jgi:hypothetical protein
VAEQLGHADTRMAIRVYACFTPSARERMAWESRNQEVLDQFPGDKNPQVRGGYARNEAACTLTVEIMSGDGDVRVRLAVAHRRRDMEDTPVNLARDQGPEVRQALFRRRDLTAWVVDVLSQAGRRLPSPASGANATGRLVGRPVVPCCTLHSSLHGL